MSLQSPDMLFPPPLLQGLLTESKRGVEGVPDLAAQFLEIEGGRERHQAPANRMLHQAVQKEGKTGVVLLVRPGLGTEPKTPPMGVRQYMRVPGSGASQPGYFPPSFAHENLLLEIEIQTQTGGR
jgi:hypothetical protein